ncbi:MAG TPA: hypothetical protein VIL30_10085 [Ramlibacter sp.]|jgi:FtsH-binding integral membrane protein
MHDLLHRLALGLLFTAGVATLAEAVAIGWPPATLSLQHHQVLLALTGAGLALAPWWPPLRIPATAVALLSNLTLLALALAAPAGSADAMALLAAVVQAAMLVTAGAILAREARQEARWNMAWRQEG